MQRRSQRALHSDDDPVKLRTPGKRTKEVEEANRYAVPAPPSIRKRAPPKRATPAKQQQEEDESSEEQEEAASSSTQHTPRARRSLASSISNEVSPASPTSSSTAASSADDDSDSELRDSSRFLLLRSFFLILIFVILYTLTQWYILEPVFQPHRTDSYKRMQAAQLREKIAGSICPPGQDCNYKLKDEYTFG